MSFSCPIKTYQKFGVDCARVEVPLTILGTAGSVEHLFVFDTGCEVTMVSEDVAVSLGLAAGGPQATLSSATGTAAARLVAVRFQFPPDAISGAPGLEVDSTWVVVGGRRKLAAVGFNDIHQHFGVQTDRDEVYFLPWPGPP